MVQQVRTERTTGSTKRKTKPCLFVIVPGTKPNRQHEAATIAFLRYRTLLQVCFSLLGLFYLPKADLIIFLKKLDTMDL